MSRCARYLPALALACASPLSPLSPACAHAFLQRASPAVGSTISTAPAAVSIAFTSDVEPSFSAITVRSGDGIEVDDGHVRAESASVLSVGLKTLPPGRYQVRWHAVSVDTHRTEGSFAFTVAPPGR